MLRFDVFVHGRRMLVGVFNVNPIKALLWGRRRTSFELEVIHLNPAAIHVLIWEAEGFLV